MTHESKTTEISDEEFEKISDLALNLFREWDRKNSIRHTGPRKETSIEYWIMKAMKEDGYEKR